MTAADPNTATASTATPRFVHLHLHSEYSLLDGGNTIDELIERVKAVGMDAVAVTDHGNLHAAAEFYTKATAAGIKPILGIEAYVAPEDRRHKKATGVADGGFHLVLLAEDNIGWRNLLKLSSDSFLTGFYRKPRMDKETLAQWSDGLIAINGHLGSSIAWHLTKYAQTHNDAHYKAAMDEARWHAKTFGRNSRGEPRFYIEVQRHDVQLQMDINPHLVQLARDLSLPLVCDNDAHFLTADHWDSHDTLCCISMAKLKSDQARIRYSKQLYVKTPQEMAALFDDLPEAVENTAKIADRCNVELDFEANHAPVVKIKGPGDFNRNVGEQTSDAQAIRAAIDNFKCTHPAGSTEWYNAFCSQFSLDPFESESDNDSSEELKQQCDAALRLLAEAGAIWRYGTAPLDADKRNRLERELTILADKHISAYFLIVWDVVNWARQQGIPANARGSGVGTMVGYVLGLSNACPVHYGLLFERFTDPDRSEYPDIDIDICQDGRAACIEYVRHKYGHVAQIITFGRLKARAAIKDVARVQGLNPSEGQRLANLVPDELNISIDDALEKDPDFRAEYDNNPQSRQVIDTARQLEGHARHAGIHAAGVVIATQPLDNIVPLCKPTAKQEADESVVSALTQWDGPTCERVGLLKMDFLGLRTLSTIERCKQLICETLPEDVIVNAVPSHNEQRRRHPLDLDRLEYTDQRVLDLFRRGDTAGIFQFESPGMRKLLVEMQPDRLEDLIAANALYRPGPMDLIPEYCARKHGRQPVPQIHEIVDQFTAETYGIMVYQEQVMQIVHGLGDIPLRQAYTLIKAISKKKHAVIDSNRPKFIEGAKEKGLSEREANDLFDLILKFAGYGFNKSHSTGYAIIAYQTAYLKTYFPNQYMAALLSYESAARKVDDWVPYLNDCRNTRFPDHTEEKPHVGVEVRPPAVNLSDRDFTVVFEPDETPSPCTGHVRFGLKAIKNAGRSAIDAIVQERQANGSYTSIFDFCERVGSKQVNKATMESLIKAGAFDRIHDATQRAAMIATLDDAIAAGQALAEDRAAGQMNFFAGADDDNEQNDAGEASENARPLPNVPAWDQLTMLQHEKEVLGIHISGHPLDKFDATLRAFCKTTTTDVAHMAQNATAVLGGLITSVRTTVTRKDARPMAIVTLEDRTGSVEAVAFPRTFAEFGQHLRDGEFVCVIGQVDLSRNQPQIICDRVFLLHDAPAELGGRIIIDIADQPVHGANNSSANGSNNTTSSSTGNPATHATAATHMQMIRGILGQAASTSGQNGRTAEIFVRLRCNGSLITLRSRSLRAVATPPLLDRLKDVVGSNAVQVQAGDIELRNDNTSPYRRHHSPAAETAIA